MYTRIKFKKAWEITIAKYKVMHLFYKQREKVCYLDVFCYKAII